VVFSGDDVIQQEELEAVFSLGSVHRLYRSGSYEDTSSYEYSSEL
jgi:hypothetical protein